VTGFIHVQIIQLWNIVSKALISSRYHYDRFERLAAMYKVKTSTVHHAVQWALKLCHQPLVQYLIVRKRTTKQEQLTANIGFPLFPETTLVIDSTFQTCYRPHGSYLRKGEEESHLESALTFDADDDHNQTWAIMFDKGYQGAQNLCRAIIPTKAPKTIVETMTSMI